MARTISFEGKIISVPDDATDDEIASILDPSTSPTKEETTTTKLENMKLQAQSGLAKTANMLTAGTVGAASLGVDAGISAITGEDYNSPVTDWLSKNIIGPNLTVQEQAANSSKQHTDGLGIASSVVGGLGGMLPDMLMGSPLQKVTTVAPRVGASVLEAALPAIQKGFAGGLPMSTKHGLDRYLESEDKGNTTTESILAGLGGFGNMAAQTTAPMGMAGTLGKRVGTGIAANVPLGIGGRQFENMASPENMQQGVYDPVAMLTDAATGGLMHGVMGARSDTPAKPKPPQADPLLAKEQGFDTSLAERKVQLETAIQHGNDALTQMAGKTHLSEAEVLRVEKLATELQEHQRQLDALNDVQPKIEPTAEGNRWLEEIYQKVEASGKTREEFDLWLKEVNELQDKLLLEEKHSPVPEDLWNQMGTMSTKDWSTARGYSPDEIATFERSNALIDEGAAKFGLTMDEVAGLVYNPNRPDYSALWKEGKHPKQATTEEITLKPLDDFDAIKNDAELQKWVDDQETARVQQVKTDAVNKYVTEGWEEGQATRYVDAIERGDILGGLKELASNTAVAPYFRVLAQALSRKGFLGERKVTVDPNLTNNGKKVEGLSRADGSISVKEYTNPKVFVHETLHSVTRGALAKFREGLPLSGKASKAIKSLTNLYNFVNTPEHQTKFKEALIQAGKTEQQAEANVRSVFKNVDEFMAHGTGTEPFVNYLRTVAYKKTTGLSAMVKELGDFFGWKKEETTALQKLYEVTDKIIDASKKDDLVLSGKDLPDDVPSKITDNFDKRISQLGVKINGKLFTAQLRSIYSENPVVQKVDKILQTADRAMDSLVSSIFGGTSKSADYNKSNKYFFTLKKLQSGDGLIPAILKNEYPDIHGVIKALQEGHDLGRSYEDTLAVNKFNDNQRILAESLIRMASMLINAENTLRSSAGLRKIPFRTGFFPAIRRGDHSVVISKNGVPFHAESFLSKAEADAFIKKNQGKAEMSYVENKPGDNTENVMKLFDDIQAALEEGRSLDGLRGEYSQDQAGVSTHAMRRTGMPGFIGTEIGLTPAQSGKRFADNIESYVREYAESIRKRQVMLGTDKVLAEHKDTPNASKVAEIMRDYSIGKTSEPQWLKDMGTWWKEKIDKAIVRNPYHTGKLDVHAWDRMSGFLSHIFYASTLTMRPSIWIAQTLTYFNSLRGLGREDVSPIQAMAAVGESWVALARGKHVSPDLVKGIQYVSQHLNTFHPQLTNQLNRLSVGRNPESTANQILRILTGEKMSAGGDTVSRFMTWMTYYHVYERMGYKGKDLWTKAAEAADENMFVYSKSHQPALYRDLGIVGDQMSPLKTFAHGQLGLLVSDMRNFINQPNAKTAVPLALTAMMSVVFGGMISVPIVAEYELLRKLAVSMGMISEEDFPSVTKTLLEKPEWLSHGLVSSSTGMDIGASMRYNSLVGNLVNAQNGWAAMFPAAGFVGTVGVNTLQMAYKKATGDLTEGEKYAHMKKIVPKGPVWAGIDETVFKSHERSSVPLGKRMESLTPQTDEAIWAARLGSRSLQEAKDSTKNLLNAEGEKKRNELKARAVDLILEGKTERATELLIKAKVDPHTVKSMLTNQIDRRNRPVLDRFYTNKQGGVTSYEQKRKLLEMAGYIEADRD